MKNMLEYNHAVKKSTGQLQATVLPFRHYAVNFRFAVLWFTLYSHYNTAMSVCQESFRRFFTG